MNHANAAAMCVWRARQISGPGGDHDLEPGLVQQHLTAIWSRRVRLPQSDKIGNYGLDILDCLLKVEQVQSLPGAERGPALNYICCGAHLFTWQSV
jgi:hypothetical protein